MRDKILKILNDKIKPMLQADGGDLELVDVDEKKGIVKVRMTGMCSHCPMAEITFRRGIEEVLKKEMREVKEVELVK
ncbi:MAG: NifU family protein [bacterium]